MMMNENKNTVIVVQGPTASGKSALAEAICRELGGVVVSCDSMQIYKGMDIGTAKPTVTDRLNTEYRMIDIVEPWEEFSCADFTDRASREIEDIINAGKLPVLCGGTGLYIDNLLYRTDFSPAGGDDEYRTSLDVYSNDELHAMLSSVDTESALNIHKNNRKRVVRALEIYHLTGKTKSYWDSLSRVKSSPYNPVKITLVSSDREFLYNRINVRVDKMIDMGLVEEASGIDLEKCQTAGQAIAYKELNGYFKGEKSLNEAIDALKQASRNYAKRQITWFSRNNDGLILDISQCDFKEQLEKSLEYIKIRIKEI